MACEGEQARAAVARLRAVPAGRFLRLLRDEPHQADPLPSPDVPRTSQVGHEGSERRAAWRKRAGVRQLPTGDLLTLEEGFHRAFVVGDLDIVHQSVPVASEDSSPCHKHARSWEFAVAMSHDEAWHECTSRDATFPYLLAAYQHFVRAGWALSSGLKYGATYLLYPATTSAQQASACRGASSSRSDACAGAAHGHAPYAVYVVPPRLLANTPGGGQKRKRLESARDYAAGDVIGTTQGGYTCSEPSERWAAIQSFSRLAAHVSKKAIIAYVSCSSEPPNPASYGSCIEIRELHLNRWIPASSGSDSSRGTSSNTC